MQADPKYLTLKHCLLGLAVLILLAGTLRHGLYEVAHALSHYVTDGHGHHSHHVGGVGTDHHHVVLEISHNALELHDAASLPAGEDELTLSYDRILHVIVPFAPDPQSFRWENKKIPLFDLQLPPSPFRRTATPPPDFSA